MKKFLKWASAILLGTVAVSTIIKYEEKKETEFFEKILDNAKRHVHSILDNDDKIIGTFIEMNDYMMTSFSTPVIVGGVSTTQKEYQFIASSETGEILELNTIRR